MIPLQPFDHVEEVTRSIEFRTREFAQWMKVDIVDASAEEVEDGLQSRGV